MLETVLTVGSSAAWLPTAESKAGAGTLCQNDYKPGIYNKKGKYLPFAPNGINYVASAGEDVISGKFTGCIMAVFVHKGERRVCHVSTGKGQDCKAKWQEIKAASANVVEFKPSDFIDTGGRALVGCYGLITADGKNYSITVVSNKGANVVASIKKVS